MYNQNLMQVLDFHIMKVEEFIDACAYGAFIDDDGYGHPVKGELFDSSINVLPSNLKETIPSDATHVVWFNR